MGRRHGRHDHKVRHEASRTCSQMRRWWLRMNGLFLDLHIPYLDGLDLRQCHLVWPQVPVILMSGHLLDIAWPAMAHGSSACLPEPIDPEKLISVLSEAISGLDDDSRFGQGDKITHMLEAQRCRSVPERATDRCRAC